MSDMTDFMERVLKELRKVENWFYTERQYCSESGWNTYGYAKNNHRWFASYTGQVAGLNPDDYADRIALLDAMAARIGRVIVDHDYPFPSGAIKKARTILDEFRVDPTE